MGSSSSFVSAIILLTMVMYIFGLLFMQGVRGHLSEMPTSSYVSALDKYYGSLDKTFWTLIGSVTGGYDWAIVAEPICAIGFTYVFFFLLYISFVMLGLLNILNGIFVNAALQSSAMNRELAIDSVIVKRESMIEDMVALFLEADSDQSGTVSWEEFKLYLQDEKIKAYFMALELDMTSAMKIFELLDADRTGELELVEFVEGCIALRGTAKMVDFAVMQREYKGIGEKVDIIYPIIRRLQDSMSVFEKYFEHKQSRDLMKNRERDGEKSCAKNLETSGCLTDGLPPMEA